MKESLLISHVSIFRVHQFLQKSLFKVMSFSSCFQKWSFYGSETNYQLAQRARRSTFILAFFGLMSLGSLFQASDMKSQIKYYFWQESFVRKLFCPALTFEKPEKKARLLTRCASCVFVLNKKKGHFWNQHEKSIE